MLKVKDMTCKYYLDVKSTNPEIYSVEQTNNEVNANQLMPTQDDLKESFKEFYTFLDSN